jgi:hypothetical protein
MTDLNPHNVTKGRNIMSLTGKRALVTGAPATSAPRLSDTYLQCRTWLRDRPRRWHRVHMKHLMRREWGHEGICCETMLACVLTVGGTAAHATVVYREPTVVRVCADGAGWAMVGF